MKTFLRICAFIIVLGTICGGFYWSYQQSNILNETPKSINETMQQEDISTTMKIKVQYNWRHLLVGWI